MSLPLQPIPSSGYFSNIDSIHIHVDGGGDIAAAQYIVDKLREKGLEGKTTQITDFIAGPQREDAWALGTYESHTPGTARSETLEFFSTTLLSHDLRGLPKAVQSVNQILSMLFERQDNMPSGIVVEVERVIGNGQEEIQWSSEPVDESYVVRSVDVGFERVRTADVEIHYALDIPRVGKWVDESPISLRELGEACKTFGVRVGGWFSFTDEDNWSYRSNQFARIGSEKIAIQQRKRLADHMAKLGGERDFECRPRTLVEQVLGVWRTPLNKVDPELRKSVRDLAQWEARNLNLQEFWVIAPNFLGDTRGDVRRAMIRNLRNGVKYTYFLRSYADIQRLRKFTESLEPDVQGAADVYNLMEAVLLESLPGKIRDVFEQEYFVADPHAQHREGYKLSRNSKGEIYEGSKMRVVDFETADILKSLLQQHQIKQWMKIPILRSTGKTRPKAVMCVHLDPLTVKVDYEDSERLFREFDRVVAENASKLSGHVVKGSMSSYIIIFDDAELSLECARRLQRSVSQNNMGGLDSIELPLPAIAIDFGHVAKAMRSYGFDFVGRPVSVSSKLVGIANVGTILVTKNATDILSPAARLQYKLIETGAEATDELGPVNCWNLDWA